MKTFLHVGCGHSNKSLTTKGFNNSDWNEVRLDINPDVRPDVVGTIVDMSAIPSGSVDAVFSSHNIEHIYPHEVPLALSEFLRVLKPDGFAVITCPDLQSVCALVADNKLTDTAYISPIGSITPLDILYGYRPQLAAGDHHMAHKCGFTLKVLMETQYVAGFRNVVGLRSRFDLWTVATKGDMPDEAIRHLAMQHFQG